MNNDFGNDYKNEMNEQTPSPASLAKLASAMSEKENKKKFRADSKAGRRVLALAVAAVMLAVLALPLALHFAHGGNNAPVPSDPVIPSSPAIEHLTVENYDEIYEVIHAAVGDRDYRYYTKNGLGVIYEEAIPEAADGVSGAPADTAAPTNAASAPGKNDSKSTTSGNDTPEYSDTNLQVAGVQEADIIKTDGRYIYAVSNNYLHIVEAKDGKLSLLSKISRKASDDTAAPTAIDEMYVTGDRLVVIKSDWQIEVRDVYAPLKYDYYKYYNGMDYVVETVAPTDYDKYEQTDVDGDGVPDYALVPETYYSMKGYGADIYDISDRSNPKLLNTLTQDGYYISSRMIGGVLYLITNKYVYGGVDINDPSTFIPAVDGSLLKPDCIYLTSKGTYEDSQYLIISGIDTTGEGKFVSTKSLFGCGSNVYCSTENLYVTSYTDGWADDVYSSSTRIFKFSLDGGKVELIAEATVPGTVLNQFSLDEKDGYLRMVTTYNSFMREIVGSGTYRYETMTTFKQANCLYVLDKNLYVVGKIEDLAPDERIYSARFDGDVAYFVTFRQVDPLFTVDLSDPTSPKVLSELKIPGFSEYLHPWTDKLLFGFGKYANPDTGRTGELKLSMFDVSDKSDVSEAHTLTIEGADYSSASYNHKAILINAAKNIIAFPSVSYNYYNGNGAKYLVYSYDEELGFKKVAEFSVKGDEYYWQEMRGLFIGDYLYVCSTTGIASYKLADFSFVDSVNMD